MKREKEEEEEEQEGGGGGGGGGGLTLFSFVCPALLAALTEL